MPEINTQGMQTKESLIDKVKTILPIKKSFNWKPVKIGVAIFGGILIINWILPGGIPFLPANPLGQKSVITVIGEGRVKAVPDKVELAVTIASTGSNANQALSNAKVQVQRFLGDLKAKGLSESEIKMASYNVTDPLGGGEQKIYGAGTTILISTKNVMIGDELVQLALNQGARLTLPLTYAVDDQDKLGNEARESAIKDAKAKAAKVAYQFGKRLGKMRAYTEAGTDEGGLTTESATQGPREIEMIQTVQVSFEVK